LGPARYLDACWITASTNRFIANSLIRTISGEYGDRPPKAKRAATNASAAGGTSAVLSTTATVRAFAGESRLRSASGAEPVWETMRTLLRKAASGLSSLMAKVSASRACERILRSTAGSAMVFFVNCYRQSISFDL
jgi:hypothetical protein